jgi:hypothetical protein
VHCGQSVNQCVGFEIGAGWRSRLFGCMRFDRSRSSQNTKSTSGTRHEQLLPFGSYSKYYCCSILNTSTPGVLLVLVLVVQYGLVHSARCSLHLRLDVVRWPKVDRLCLGWGGCGCRG